MSVVHGTSFGLKICNLLGIDASQVRDVVIKVSAEGLARINVEMFVTEDQAGESFR